MPNISPPRFASPACSESGRVRDVTVERSFNTVLSRIDRLRLSYDGDDTDAPGSIILQRPVVPERAATFWHAGRNEVAFYNTVGSAMSEHLVPRCYEAVSDADTKAWHLLLEDLTESHFVATTWPQPPTFAQCEQIVRSRARFHAAWWNDARLGVTIGAWQESTELDQQVQTLTRQLEKFTERQGDRLSPERRELYARLLDAAPRLQASLLFPLQHDDRPGRTPMSGTSFCRKMRNSDEALQFDWDSWRVDTASDDLAI